MTAVFSFMMSLIHNLLTILKIGKNEFLTELGLSESDDFPFLLLGNKTDLPGKSVEEDAAAFFQFK